MKKLTHELLEHARNGNYYPHGEYESEDAAHKDAKRIGLKRGKYTVKEHQQPHWKQD